MLAWCGDSMKDFLVDSSVFDICMSAYCGISKAHSLSLVQNMIFKFLESTTTEVLEIGNIKESINTFLFVIIESSIIYSIFP